MKRKHYNSIHSPETARGSVVAVAVAVELVVGAAPAAVMAAPCVVLGLATADVCAGES